MTKSSSNSYRNTPLRWLLRIGLIVVGAACLYLAWTALQGDARAGCIGGGEVACGDVLASRWSYWAGMPVGLPAAAVYATMLAVSLFLEPWVPAGPNRLARLLLVGMSGGLVVAATWFVGLQAFWLEAFCPVCMLVHFGGFITFGLALFVAGLPRPTTAVALVAGGLLVAVTLPAGQIWGGRVPYELERVVNRHGIAPFRMQPANSTMIPFDAPQPAVIPTETQSGSDAGDPDAGDPDAGAVPAVEDEGQIGLLDGLVRFRLDEHPHIFGRGDGPVVVMLFDYNCDHCRRLNRYLGEVARERQGELTVVLMATPLHPACNRHVIGEEGIEGSCELARLALAIWQLEPQRFQAYHEWMFATKEARSVEDARKEAERMVDPRRLRAALDEGLVDSRLAQQTELYGYVGAGVVPKLLLPRAILSGTPDSAAELRRILRRQAAERGGHGADVSAE